MTDPASLAKAPADQGLVGELASGMAAVDAEDWDALHGTDPFLSHAFLAGLESSGSLSTELGWRAQPLLLRRAGKLVAAAPLYLKGNSHGEFVFDHGWAEAYRQHGQSYYPKALVAVPYTPVSGQRLLVAETEDVPSVRTSLLAALEGLVEHGGLSSAHINFLIDPIQTPPGWVERLDWQYHWIDRGFGDFDGFLAELRAKRRKEIRRERRLVQDAGVSFVTRSGSTVSANELDFAHRCYVDTFAAYGNTPALTRDMFDLLAEQLGDRFVIIFAQHAAGLVAAAVFLRSDTALYGRYWGARVELPGLHFETCYYQGIEYCLANGLSRFEPGAQGEHKIARGFEPVGTRSLHYIADPVFREAISRSLDEESALWARRGARLQKLSAYRQREDFDAPAD